MQKPNKGYWCIGLAVGVIVLFWMGISFFGYLGIELFKSIEEDIPWTEFFDWELDPEDRFYGDAYELLMEAKSYGRKNKIEEGKAIVLSYDCLSDGEDDYENVFSYAIILNDHGKYRYYVQLGEYYLGGMKGIPLTEERHLRHSSYSNDREEFQEFYYDVEEELINPSTDEPFSLEEAFYACPSSRYDVDSSL